MTSGRLARPARASNPLQAFGWTGMIVPEGTQLFTIRSLREFVQKREQQVGDFINSMGEAEILGSNINNLFDAAGNRFLFGAPELNLERTMQDTADNAVFDRQFV